MRSGVRKAASAWFALAAALPASAGVDFTAGPSAIVELARQIDRIASFTNVDRGITVNPGVISGGTRSNVIAAEASARSAMKWSVATRAAAMKMVARAFPCAGSVKPSARCTSSEIASTPAKARTSRV